MIDKAGRIVIPKPLREELHLEPGDSLEMESAGERITLRPVRGTGPLTMEHGVWVFYAGQPLPRRPPTTCCNGSARNAIWLPFEVFSALTPYNWRASHAVHWQPPSATICHSPKR